MHLQRHGVAFLRNEGFNCPAMQVAGQDDVGPPSGPLGQGVRSPLHHLLFDLWPVVKRVMRHDDDQLACGRADDLPAPVILGGANQAVLMAPPVSGVEADNDSVWSFDHGFWIGRDPVAIGCAGRKGAGDDGEQWDIVVAEHRDRGVLQRVHKVPGLAELAGASALHKVAGNNYQVRICGGNRVQKRRHQIRLRTAKVQISHQNKTHQPTFVGSAGRHADLQRAGGRIVKR